MYLIHPVYVLPLPDKQRKTEVERQQQMADKHKREPLKASEVFSSASDEDSSSSSSSPSYQGDSDDEAGKRYSPPTLIYYSGEPCMENIHVLLSAWLLPLVSFLGLSPNLLPSLSTYHFQYDIIGGKISIIHSGSNNINLGVERLGTSSPAFVLASSPHLPLSSNVLCIHATYSWSGINNFVLS